MSNVTEGEKEMALGCALMVACLFTGLILGGFAVWALLS